MSAVVLDTVVIRELLRLRPEPKVVDFLHLCEEPIVSVIVLHEIAHGVERLRDAAKRARLELFMRGLKETFRDRIIEIDVALAELAGCLRARASRAGWTLAQFDSLIAATAISRGAHIATRDFAPFARLEIPLVDPWSD